MRFAWALLLLSACPAPAVERPPVRPTPTSSATTTAKPADPPVADGTPALTIELTPHVAQERVEVSVVASGAAAELMRFRIAEGQAGALAEVTAKDGEGTVPLKVAQDGVGVSLVLARAPRGSITLRYFVPADDAFAAAEPLSVAVDPTRMRVSGERVLALPAAFDDRGTAITLRIHPGDVPGTGAASSFGVGQERRFRALGRELREATYLGGIAGWARFEAEDGRDEAAWLGYTSFEPRQVSADLAAFRAAVGGVLKRPDPVPLTLLFVSTPRASGDYDVQSRTASLLVHLGAGQEFSPGLRMRLATAIVQQWVGRMVWVGPTGADQAKAYWFVEGVARFLARELLWSFGLVDADDRADEVNRLLSIVTTDPRRAATNDELAASLGEGTLPLIAARGALYATLVDHQLRQAKPARSLEGVMAKLIARAVEQKGPLSEQQWLDALEGTTAPADLGEWITKGKTGKLAADTLGPCFMATTLRYDVFALGFDIDKTMADGEKKVSGLDPKGPAAKAGVQAGDVLGSLHYLPGRADHQVRMVVKRGEKEERIGYMPVGEQRAGQGFARRPGVPDDQCGP